MSYQNHFPAIYSPYNELACIKEQLCNLQVQVDNLSSSGSVDPDQIANLIALVQGLQNQVNAALLIAEGSVQDSQEALSIAQGFQAIVDNVNDQLSSLSTSIANAIEQSQSAIQLSTNNTIEINKRVPFGSAAQLRSYPDTTLQSFHVSTKDTGGMFYFDPTDTTSADDGAMVIVQGTRRFKRQYSGAVNAMWFGLKGDGSTDETTLWQSILNNPTLKTIYFPKPPISYRINSITMTSNKTLIFEDGTIVFGLGLLTLYQRMVYIVDVVNLTIKGNVIFKDLKTSYPEINPSINSQRHLFIIQGSTNINIEGVSANDSGGDGFYIGSSTAQNFCQNVRLVNCTANNNKRQGLSLISGKNIEVIDSVFSNTKDDTPGAGIDIEPNVIGEFLQNIRFVNCRTWGNQGAGFIIAPGALAGSLNPVSIVISGHYDNGSRYGFVTSYATGALSGSIIIENAVWEDNLFHSCLIENYSSDFPKLSFKDCKSINANASNSLSVTYGAAIILFREASQTGSLFLGNVEFINPEVIETRSVKQVKSGIKLTDLNLTLNSGGGVKRCSIINPRFSGVTGFNRVQPRGEVYIEDNLEVLAVDTANLTRSYDFFSYAPLFHNATCTVQTLVNLAKVTVDFPEVTFEVRATPFLYIKPEASDNILPISTVVGKSIFSSTVGNRITLKKKANNSWFVKEMIGTWQVEP